MVEIRLLAFLNLLTPSFSTAGNERGVRKRQSHECNFQGEVKLGFAFSMERMEVSPVCSLA